MFIVHFYCSLSTSLALAMLIYVPHANKALKLNLERKKRRESERNRKRDTLNQLHQTPLVPSLRPSSPDTSHFLIKQLRAALGTPGSDVNTDQFKKHHNM
jgi:hypothetical protein